MDKDQPRLVQECAVHRHPRVDVVFRHLSVGMADKDGDFWANRGLRDRDQIQYFTRVRIDIPWKFLETGM